MSGRSLQLGTWRAAFDEAGALASLSNGSREFVPGPARPVVVEVGGLQLTLDARATCAQSDEALRFEHELAERGLSVRLDYRLLPLAGEGVAVEQSVTLIPHEELSADIAVRLPASISVGSDCEVFAPKKNGVGASTRGGPPVGGHFAWELGGRSRMFLGGYVDALGLPLVSERGKETPWRLTWCADPYFTTAFFLRPRWLAWPERELNWRYLAAVPMKDPEQHRVYACLHEGDEEEAIQAFYDTALAEIPPGPSWLHDIALTHYDYFSDRGRGWFADVDTLTERIPPGERHEVCLCLHGWYDLLGRYSMNPETREIDEAWTLVRGPDYAEQADLELTRDTVRSMLRYARERGFRVVLYYADGLAAAADWAAETFPTDAVLRCSGWEEGVVHTVLLNPAHDAVRDWFLDYTRALTRAFGDEIDGFNWDETYYIAQHEIGPASTPAYLDRAFMELMRDVATVVHEHRSDLALLGSDCIGLVHSMDGTGRGAPGYSLVVDGCWQDTTCSPEAWPFAIFPNFRNVFWSCNWWPVDQAASTEYGVEEFATPAATSHGTGYGETRPLSEYPGGVLDEILKLFRKRAATPRRPFWLAEGDPRIAGPFGTHLPEASFRIPEER